MTASIDGQLVQITRLGKVRGGGEGELFALKAEKLIAFRELASAFGDVEPGGVGVVEFLWFEGFDVTVDKQNVNHIHVAQKRSGPNVGGGVLCRRVGGID